MSNLMYMNPEELYEHFKKDLYITYRFYDDRKRRLAIFAHPTYSEYAGENPDVLHIVVFTCNKLDVFNKEKVKDKHRRYFTEDRKELEKEGIKPQEFYTLILQGKGKWSFMNFCKTKFVKLHETVIKVKGKMVSCEPTAMKFGKMVGGQNDTFLKVKSLF